MYGWTDVWDFTSFLTAFQSYKDNKRVIMKGCLQWSPIYSRKEFLLEPVTARPAVQRLNYGDIGGPHKVVICGKYKNLNNTIKN